MCVCVCVCVCVYVYTYIYQIEDCLRSFQPGMLYNADGELQGEFWIYFCFALFVLASSKEANKVFSNKKKQTKENMQKMYPRKIFKLFLYLLLLREASWTSYLGLLRVPFGLLILLTSGAVLSALQKKMNDRSEQGRHC